MIATPYMGKQKGNEKGSADIILRDKDTPQAIADQWAQFREEFMGYNSAFLFHQINHYSLIYALREWQDYKGVKHRQLLYATLSAVCARVCLWCPTCLCAQT